MLTDKDLPLIKSMLQCKLSISDQEIRIHPRNQRVMNQYEISVKWVHQYIRDVPIQHIRALNHQGTKYRLEFVERPLHSVRVVLEMDMIVDRHGINVEVAKIHIKH